MKPTIKNGVLITKHEIIQLNEMYAITKYFNSIFLYPRAGCKKAIELTRDTDDIWQLIADYFNWELDVQDNLD